MNSNEMLDKIREKDKAAFMLLMDSYGKKLYASLLKQTGDKALADAAFKETMVDFYSTLTDPKADNLAEALLLSFGENAAKRAVEKHKAPEPVEKQEPVMQEEPVFVEEPLMQEEAAFAEEPLMQEEFTFAEEPASQENSERWENLDDTSGQAFDQEAPPPQVAYIEQELRKELMKMQQGASQTEQPTQPETELIDETDEPVQPAKQKKSKVGLFFGIGGLSLGILAALWVISGILMSLDILPDFDLGYQWFNMNIAPWF